MGAKGVFIFIAPVTLLLFNEQDISFYRTIEIVGLLFVPQFILALFSTIGFSMSSLKLVVQHPETVLLPIGTSLNIVQTRLDSIV